MFVKMHPYMILLPNQANLNEKITFFSSFYELLTDNTDVACKSLK